MQDPNSNRPIVGQINFNLAFIDYSEYGVQAFAKVLIHEMMHVMAFSDSLYRSWITP